MSRDPFKASKRDWKRYDPEPPPRDNSFREWELYVWTVTCIVALWCMAVIVSGGGHSNDAKPQRATTTTAQR